MQRIRKIFKAVSEKTALLAQIWSQKTFLWVLPLLDVIHCCKLSLYAIFFKKLINVRQCCKLSLHAISRKHNKVNLRKWQKRP